MGIADEDQDDDNNEAIQVQVQAIIYIDEDKYLVFIWDRQHLSHSRQSVSKVCAQ
jgi:hypothetical protein